jgi:hypothetical protein
MSEVPCDICGDPTPMLATKRCDRCWELERRIERDPHLARKILARVEKEDNEWWDLANHQPTDEELGRKP